ncbi:MAG: hypothetical protein AB7V36_07460 [Bacteroidales bacterium]|jgi:hypothetical protein|nr:hypothetical protein [Bacteroidales bacterium]HPB02040.1 hypothetical protein [Bacteroidales bacterium]
MAAPDDNFIQQNNYNFALEEEFDYLDELSRELEEQRKTAEKTTPMTIKENGFEENESSKPLKE